ncbi:Membrane-bound inhibitor of C-type lysozyme [Methylobacterium sp. UNC378MF]|jgi:membrane-bound inhibitor of C-type lysozyme|uniref:MliC family protein n=1 Tax=Methylobacterium sp. UNC378MF TaxID=1502748 RepID=UPI000881FAD4|nr:MliC family protein [Methylobacterium sp. UNC378MF]SDA34762.1 Membrane-bound inhibitor of C-type lysozyme [Methylobacterium sp. UNC378MF]
MTTRIRAAWLAILGGVFVAAGPGQAETIDVTFACPDGQMLAVTFLNAAGPEQAVVRPGNGVAVTLPVQLSGSGFRYADATHELRGKGQSVTWTAGSAKPVTCSERKPAGTGPR